MKRTIVSLKTRCVLAAWLIAQACQPKPAPVEQSLGNRAVAETPVRSSPAVPAAKPTYDTPAPFQTQIKDVWQTYLAIKDALVASDVVRAGQQAVAFEASLKKTDAGVLSLEARRGWAAQVDSLIRQSALLRAGKTLGSQREAFERLSAGVYTLVRQVGVNGATVYRQYCPMAFNDQGAYWLSAESEIKNPYFGDQMLECGKVEEALRFGE